MKKMSIFAFVFLCITSSAFARVGDDGWSSSGGGEFIITQKNPWFMGPETVKWCIDHGGEDKFSLPYNLAKNEIEKGIEVLAKQLKTINKHSALIIPDNDSPIFRKCGVRRFYKGQYENRENDGWDPFCDYDIDNTDVLEISDKFEYTPSCAAADIEFILGNYNNEKIKKYIDEIGVNKFNRFVGLAMRTQYSEITLRSKGFIYITADKGEIQYSGPRNVRFGQEKTFWNNFETIKASDLFPDNLYGNHGIMRDDISWPVPYLKDYALGLLMPVITHEFGHILGLEHTNFKNYLMNEDYPANLVADGLAFQGNFYKDSMVFSRGLIELDMDRRLGFELQDNVDTDVMKKFSPKMSTFLEIFRWSADYLLVFDIYNNKNNISSVQLLTRDVETLEYHSEKKYEIEIEKNCLAPTKENAINLRYQLTDTLTETITLLTFNNNSYCGKIYVNRKDRTKFLIMRLTHNYYRASSELNLYDPDTGYSHNIHFNDSDIFGTPKDQFLNAMPVFKLNEYWIEGDGFGI